MNLMQHARTKGIIGDVKTVEPLVRMPDITKKFALKLWLSLNDSDVLLKVYVNVMANNFPMATNVPVIMLDTWMKKRN